MQIETYTTLLEEALDGWQGTRKGLIAEVQNLNAEQLRFRPRPDMRSGVELVQHIIEVGLIMGGELVRLDADFRRQGWSDFLREYAPSVGAVTDRDELIDLLHTSHSEADRAIRKAGELVMLQHIRRFDGRLGTRLAWLWSGSGHEYYHRGQLASYARLQGIEPALTKKIRAAGNNPAKHD